ncbi:ankyrin [Colletotrichum higginsianum IMI 349063]|uniref:Ankyrin n=1 Tax=Colletotrichum higginsianum (strain IMI 349063) TaxID=759273 RepID=A0A1B7Y7T6_COLHI|nr:ankyrin [Colletotrichum higginsianum IMI 349063]OBR08057.1 ankyrin [Colletotrichum higginsianum IMI 349063]GJC97849.1 ankyrin [Colletotrichum higginsianum]
MVDVRRLYHGAGGKVHSRPPAHDPLSTKEHCCSSPAPATPASCGSTLPFEDVPADRGSPPPYDECSSKGQSLKAGLDAAAIVAESLGPDCDRDPDPPEYGDTERRKNVLEPSQGVFFPLRNTDTHVQPIKRKRAPTAAVCTAATSTLDAARPDKLQRSLFAGLDSRLVHVLEQQQQQIHTLQQMFKESQKRNEKLEARCDELERKCGELEDGQSGNVETVENLDIAVDELQARCDALEKQMPDVCDEMEDLKEKWLKECREEFEENERGESIEDSMANQIREGVETELNQIRRRVLRALEPTHVNEEVKTK